MVRILCCVSESFATKAIQVITYENNLYVLIISTVGFTLLFVHKLSRIIRLEMLKK